MNHRPQTEPAPTAAEDSPDDAPAQLPRSPHLFWTYRPEFEELETVEPASQQPVLEQLGPPPFPKTGFPFLGFLATVYEHVTAHVRQR